MHERMHFAPEMCAPDISIQARLVPLDLNGTTLARELNFEFKREKKFCVRGLKKLGNSPEISFVRPLSRCARVCAYGMPREQSLHFDHHFTKELTHFLDATPAVGQLVPYTCRL
jgi:hypothetical protein